MPEYGVCGGSDAGMGGCLRNATWLEAFQRCEQYGARLCTTIELMAARNTGCQLENEMVSTGVENDADLMASEETNTAPDTKSKNAFGIC